MEGEKEALPPSKPSTLRWKILRRALLPPSPHNSDAQSDVGIRRISRRTSIGFNLIPFHVVDEEIGELSKIKNHNGSSKDACFCYTLPVPDSPKLFLHQRMDDNVDLSDFSVCKRYNIDNTGIVCHWPSEDILAYYCLTHVELFRYKRVIELGSGYGLAGFVISAVTEASEVMISDGNPQVIDYLQRNIDTNSIAFGTTKVKPLMVHWDHDHNKCSELSTFDIIVASDCTFFTDFHEGLVKTIKFLLKKEGPSEAILFSPKRGDSFDKFLTYVKENGLNFSITEMYDIEVWRRHQKFILGEETWPNYETDHCYPLLIRITW
ncbi:protein modifying enzyme [Lithospermum erythrorhizon]|uniref:Calmodulin-lysine N-methyltransferase n=1 Tax=Lithospermum erythrorhizon TaxID=34254 RepID=A0AAV3PJC4_LITER